MTAHLKRGLQQHRTSLAAAAIAILGIIAYISFHPDHSRESSIIRPTKHALRPEKMNGSQSLSTQSFPNKEREVVEDAIISSPTKRERKVRKTETVEVAKSPRSGVSFAPRLGTDPTFQRPATMPLIYQLDEQKLTAAFPQVPASALEKLKEEFEEEISSDGVVDLSSPEYLRRWNMAEFNAISKLRALYGWAGFANFQRQQVLNEQ